MSTLDFTKVLYSFFPLILVTAAYFAQEGITAVMKLFISYLRYFE